MDMTKHMMNASSVAALAAATLLATCATAGAAEWGGVKGKFVYKGEAKNDPVQITKDVEYCGPKMPLDETVKVGEGGGLQNVFLYLYVARGKKVEIHPDYKPGEAKVLSNEGCRFAPHALCVWTAEEFEVHNDDPGIGHNTNLNFAANADFNLTVPNDAPLKRKFDKTEPRPAPVACNIHPWMKGNVLVRDNPYMAVSGEDGSFEITNIPAGAQEFILWHEAKGFLRDVEVGGNKADRKGQFEVTIPAGELLDLGEIEVTPALLGQ
jgi:hypothetical protein